MTTKANAKIQNKVHILEGEIKEWKQKFKEGNARADEIKKENEKLKSSVEALEINAAKSKENSESAAREFHKAKMELKNKSDQLIELNTQFSIIQNENEMLNRGIGKLTWFGIGILTGGIVFYIACLILK